MWHGKRLSQHKEWNGSSFYSSLPGLPGISPTFESQMSSIWPYISAQLYYLTESTKNHIAFVKCLSRCLYRGVGVDAFKISNHWQHFVSITHWTVLSLPVDFFIYFSISRAATDLGSNSRAAWRPLLSGSTLTEVKSALASIIFSDCFNFVPRISCWWRLWSY